MKDDRQLSLEGIKLFKDWSVWMVTAELGVISFLGSSYFRSGGPPRWVGLAGALFGLSAAAATWVLSALPWIVLRIDEAKFRNFYQAPLSSACVLRSIRVWVMAMVQHTLFVAGMFVVVLGLLRVL
jgi:hypothetical protein